jgi:isopentenyl-diphosphate delta-isomerase type 1
MRTTDPQNEQFDIVDENDTVIDCALRKEVHQNKSLIHRSISVLVFVEGKLLLQKRSQTKDTYPKYWTSSCSGHVVSGDSYEETAERELTEELGIKPDHALTVLGKDLIHFPQETEMMMTYKYDTTYPVTICEKEISEYQLYKLDQNFFVKILPKLKITPDFEFVINKYLDN